VFLHSKKITVEQIYNGAPSAQGMDELQSLKKSNQYTVLNFDRASKSMQVDLYDFATLKSSHINMILKAQRGLPAIDGYT
jgi:dipeptidyl-peptidase-4